MSEDASPPDQVRRLYAEAEKGAARAAEELVHRDSFGELLARVTENAMAITRLGFDALDLAVRNLRIAGRADLLRLGHQLGRNEDKLEVVLQEVERLQEQVRGLERAAAPSQGPAAARRTSQATSRRRSTSSPNGGSGARPRRSQNGQAGKKGSQSRSR